LVPRYWRFQQQHAAHWPVFLARLASLDEDALLQQAATKSAEQVFHIFIQHMQAVHKAYHQFLITRINNRQCHVSAHPNGTIVVIEMEPTTCAFEKLSSDRIGFMHDIALIDDPEEA
jgi:hypothetical protein